MYQNISQNAKGQSVIFNDKFDIFFKEDALLIQKKRNKRIESHGALNT